MGASGPLASECLVYWDSTPNSLGFLLFSNKRTPIPLGFRGFSPIKRIIYYRSRGGIHPSEKGARMITDLLVYLVDGMLRSLPASGMGRSSQSRISLGFRPFSPLKIILSPSHAGRRSVAPPPSPPSAAISWKEQIFGGH